jgi:hypothetical protein
MHIDDRLYSLQLPLNFHDVAAGPANFFVDRFDLV